MDCVRFCLGKVKRLFFFWSSIFLKVDSPEKKQPLINDSSRIQYVRKQTPSLSAVSRLWTGAVTLLHTTASAAAVFSPCVATGRFLHRPGVLPDKSLFAFFSLIPVPGFMRLSFVSLVLEVLVLALSLPFLDPDFLNHPETKFTRTWQSLPLIMTSMPLHLERGLYGPLRCSQSRDPALEIQSGAGDTCMTLEVIL